MTTAHASCWRRDRTGQQPTSDGSGARGAAAEVLWFNRPHAHQARLLEPEAVSCP